MAQRRDIFTAVFTIALWAATGSFGEDSKLCAEFRALKWPLGDSLGQFGLTDTLTRGSRESAEQHFFNLDIDGDDREDVVTQSCSASAYEPGGPCLLEVKLSSGGTIELEAWHMYLVRHRGAIYAITSSFDSDKDPIRHKIYRVGPREMRLVCQSR